ncbi:MAG: hypothetical protein GY810_21470 [Aureispira sp.]|nr:hypothetical protein [Aureispira sp.]
MKNLLLVLMIVPLIGFGQKLKERIGWQKYAYHITGDIYNVKIVTTYNNQGNWLKKYINKENNIDGEQRFDNQGRLIYKRLNNEHGEPFYEGAHKYYKNKDYYKKFYQDATYEDYLAYHYTNTKGQVVEEKVFKIDCYKKYTKKDDCACNDDRKWNLVGPIHKWIIKSYNKNGLLIGERYKNAKVGELSKVIYSYKKGTTLLEGAQRYYIDSTSKKDIVKPEKGIVCKYDKENRLVYKKDQDVIETFKYKRGKLWISTFTHKTWKTINTYKDGILVVSRFYWEGSGRDLNCVEDLMSSKWFKSSVFRRKRLKSLQMVILAR